MDLKVTYLVGVVHAHADATAVLELEHAHRLLLAAVRWRERHLKDARL